MVTYAENGCNSSNCFKGYFADLFHNVQTLLNFTYDLTIGDGYGRKMENGSWTSSIGISWIISLNQIPFEINLKNVKHYIN